MKVSTDACIQGAWTPIMAEVKNVLDIGTGTGLLSLMLAQRNNTIEIDAIEMDEAAADQARENITNSDWNERIHIINSDARNYAFNKKYDLIISNPPFFQNSLLGPNEERNIARHTLSLSYEDLLSIFERYLSVQGYVSIMLPFSEQEKWEKLLEKSDWQVFKRLIVYPKENAEPIRVVSLSGRKPLEKQVDEKLVVHDIANYTNEFIALLQPYYLKL